MEHYAILYVLIGLRRLLLMLLLNPRTLQDDCLAGGGAVASTPVLRLAVEQLKQLLAILEDDVPTIGLGTSQQDDVIVAAAAASSRCCGRNSCCCWLANFNPGRIVLRFLDQSIHCSLVEDERTIRVADDLIWGSRGGGWGKGRVELFLRNLFTGKEYKLWLLHHDFKKRNRKRNKISRLRVSS